MTPSAPTPATQSALAQRLRDAGIAPTRQRMAIAQVLLSRPTHMRADEVMTAARRCMPSLSRATVYNTLQLLTDKQLLRVLHLDPACMVYDSRTDAHAHLYLEDSGMLLDWDWSSPPPLPLPTLPAHLELVSVDVIVRVRQRTEAAK